MKMRNLENNYFLIIDSIKNSGMNTYIKYIDFLKISAIVAGFFDNSGKVLI